MNGKRNLVIHELCSLQCYISILIRLIKMLMRDKIRNCQIYETTNFCVLLRDQDIFLGLSVSARLTVASISRSSCLKRLQFSLLISD